MLINFIDATNDVNHYTKSPALVDTGSLWCRYRFCHSASIVIARMQTLRTIASAWSVSWSTVHLPTCGCEPFAGGLLRMFWLPCSTDVPGLPTQESLSWMLWHTCTGYLLFLTEVFLQICQELFNYYIKLYMRWYKKRVVTVTYRNVWNISRSGIAIYLRCGAMFNSELLQVYCWVWIMKHTHNLGRPVPEG